MMTVMYGDFFCLCGARVVAYTGYIWPKGCPFDTTEIQLETETGEEITKNPHLLCWKQQANSLLLLQLATAGLLKVLQLNLLETEELQNKIKFAK